MGQLSRLLTLLLLSLVLISWAPDAIAEEAPVASPEDESPEVGDDAAKDDAAKDDAATKQPAADPQTPDELEAAWAAAPTDLRLGLRLFDALCAAGERAKGLRIFRRAQQADTKNAVAAFLRARATRRVKDRAKMLSLLKAPRGLSSDKAHMALAWRALATDEAAANNWSGAVEAVNGLIAARGVAEDFAYAGWIDERRGDLQAATQNYRRALKVRDDYVHARLALSLVLARAGKQAESLKLARQAAKDAPQDASAQLHLGLVLCMAGQRSAGRKAYAKAVQVAGRNVVTLVAVAEAYRKLEDLDAASAALDKALEISPQHPGALLGAGSVALDKNDLSAARTLLDAAEKHGEPSATLFFLKGLTLERLKIWGPSLKAYKQACALAPDNDNYTVAYAMAMHRKGATSGAVRLPKRVIKQRPDDASLHFQLASLQMSRRDNKAARKSLAKVIELKPDDPRPYFYLAVILGDEMGKTKDAMAALETYERLGGREPAALKWLKKLRAATGK